MNIEELMRNDWVKISKLPIYCQVKYFTEDDKVVGKTAGGGAFVKQADELSPIELTQDTILCTPFWLVRKGVFKKVIRGVVSFVYETGTRRLVVEVTGMGVVNVHYIGFMHELQHFYRHYTGKALEVDMTYSKRKEYSRRYYHKEG